MVKGFIFFRDGKIPFVIENYRMELFTDDSLLDDFCKEYNFKENYILHGQCFDIGIRGRKATFLVENSMGSTCYLRCYTINMFDKDEEYDSIGLQSPSLDEVFRYESPTAGNGSPRKAWAYPEAQYGRWARCRRTLSWTAGEAVCCHHPEGHCSRRTK